MVDLATVTEAEQVFIAHEHRELAPGLDRIGSLAARIGVLARADLADELSATLGWMQRTLEPHIAWEDHVLYSEIDETAGTHWATQSMRFEHSQIRDRVIELSHDFEALHRERSLERLPALRGRLYGLAAILRAHMDREEQLLFPLLAG